MLSWSPIPYSFGFWARAGEESAIYSALISDLGEDHRRETISIDGKILFMSIDSLC